MKRTSRDCRSVPWPGRTGRKNRQPYSGNRRIFRRVHGAGLADLWGGAGWLFDPAYTPDVARLAVECGHWPLKEAINGVVTHTYVPKLSPVESYLKLQGRFRHLFEPTLQQEAIAHIQGSVNAYWERVNLAERTG